MDKTAHTAMEAPQGDDDVSMKCSTDDILPIPKSKSALVGDVCQVFGVFFAIGVRILLLAFCLLTVWLVTFQLDEDRYWLLSITTILMIIEGVNIVVSRAGQERKWVCVCFICYLISCIPPVWILELDRLDTFQDKTENASAVASVSVSGLTAEVRLDPSLTLSIVEQCLLFLLILCRWLLPRGEITRDQLSQLLFVFIGMASDVMELFVLFDESEVREDRKLTIAILFVWSLSLFQFSLVLTMSKNAKKRIVVTSKDSDQASSPHQKSQDTGLLHAVFKTELWSLLISITFQDGPFLTVRLYTLITYNLVNYSIIFFTCKNTLVILLLLYRLLILALAKYEEREAADDNDNEEDNATETTTATAFQTSAPSSARPRRKIQVEPEKSLDI